VCSVDSQTNEIVAIKSIDLESAEEDIEEIQKEIYMLSECQSPYITRYITSYISASFLYIVMEYCAGGSVKTILETGGAIEEIHAAVIIKEMAKALEYLHSQAKIHRDVKGRN
jgi:serine/threonine-protein kinase 24/25/MST4